MDLSEEWRQISADLGRARSTLPNDAANHEAISQYEEFMSHNELELACDMLESYAETHSVSKEFWLSLRDAATKMELYDRERRYMESMKTTAERDLRVLRADYVVRYYNHLLTEQEHIAYRHLVATAKGMHGRTDAASQTEARNSGPNHLRKLLSSDPGVLRLANEGLGTFIGRTAQRILEEHLDAVAFNNCPQCGALARTPTARQCRVCRFDWHETQPG